MRNQVSSIFVSALLVVSLTGCISTVSPPSPVVQPSRASDTVTPAEPSPKDVISTTTPAAPTPVLPDETTKPEAVQSDTTSALWMLGQLTVQPETKTGYQREYFKHWTTQNGCSTRVNVLIRDAVSLYSQNGCNITGEWFSIYDNKTTSDPSSFDIDHYVPLSEAWRSGANEWDSTTREAFANDLGYQYSLVAVSASSNRSKSDSDPSSWMPPTMDGCEYVGKWVAVKYRWQLNVDQAEHDKILSVLSWCGGDYLVSIAPTVASVTIGNTTPPGENHAPPANNSGTTDPQFRTCKEAKANGFGPYVRGVHIEYDWYRDGDKDGTVCE